MLIAGSLAEPRSSRSEPRRRRRSSHRELRRSALRCPLAHRSASRNCSEFSHSAEPHSQPMVLAISTTRRSFRRVIVRSIREDAGAGQGACSAPRSDGECYATGRQEARRPSARVDGKFRIVLPTWRPRLDSREPFDSRHRGGPHGHGVWRGGASNTSENSTRATLTSRVCRELWIECAAALEYPWVL